MSKPSCKGFRYGNDLPSFTFYIAQPRPASGLGAAGGGQACPTLTNELCFPGPRIKNPC